MEKPLHRYTQEYYDLCKKAYSKELSIPFETKRKALNFRIEMYLFRKALRKGLLSDPDSESLQIAVLFAEGLEFAIDRNVLVIKPKKSKTAEKIAEVLT